jgi:hypothetical protein
VGVEDLVAKLPSLLRLNRLLVETVAPKGRDALRIYRILFCLCVCLLLAPAPSEPLPVAELNDEPAANQAADVREPLPAKDPIAFLKKCLERFEQENIKSYTLTFIKQERIDGRLQPSEEIEVAFRANPYSVYMHWLRGERKANSVAYVEGQNGGKMLVHPAGLAGSLVKVVSRDPEGDDARQSGRYPITQFGLRNLMQRTYDSWKAAKETGNSQFEYLGVRNIQEIGNRPCYVLRRKGSAPDDTGVMEGTAYIDKESWMQVGSVLKGQQGKLLGEYLFRNIQLNPQIKANQFDASALTQ